MYFFTKYCQLLNLDSFICYFNMLFKDAISTAGTKMDLNGNNYSLFEGAIPALTKRD